MVGSHRASSVLTLLFLLTGAALLRPSRSSPIRSPGDVNGPSNDGVMAWGDEEGRDERRRTLKSNDLFNDVDPKTLAAVLLGALNQSQDERRKEGGVKDERREEEEEPGRKSVANRDRDGRQELELLMATQGKERQREEEEERRRAQEEEERMTEKVTSHTTSQQVQVQAQPKVPASEGGAEKETPAADQEQEQEEEEEEQLSPEELRSLETMMKEFPSLDTKRNGEENERESRGSSLVERGGNLAMSKKKLKWQEETQKGVNVPSFKGGNFMDEFQDDPGSDPPAKQEVMEEDEPEEEEEEEEEKEDEEDEEAALSPEEEEARARAEQDEMRRQAAEAQRAKMEEEKLADIASDMLLRYMVKQGGGNRKYGGGGGAAAASNAAEDKRSDEEPTGEDDIDPQTIDKLIEISSKLHLPADDVVDIISDVEEKKKKKDVAPEVAVSPWQQPLKSSFSGSQSSAKSYPISKQLSPAAKLLKSWFQERTRPQEHWARTNNLVSSRPQKTQDFWYKPKPVWARYPSQPYMYPLYYQRKYPDYYPVYYPPPPPVGSGPRYFVPNNNFLGNSVDTSAIFPPKRRYHSWVQPRLKAPPLASAPQKAYLPRPLYQRTFQAIPKPRPPPPQRKSAEDLEKYIQQILLSRSQRRD